MKRVNLGPLSIPGPGGLGSPASNRISGIVGVRPHDKGNEQGQRAEVYVESANFGTASIILSLALILASGPVGEALAQSSYLASAGAQASLTLTGFPLQANSNTDFDVDSSSSGAIALTQLISAVTPGGVLGTAFSTSRAQEGDLGVLLIAKIEGGGGFHSGSGIARATASATYRDRIVVSSPSLGDGDFIDLEADFDLIGKFFVSAKKVPQHNDGPIFDPGSPAEAKGSVSFSAENTPGLVTLGEDALGVTGGSTAVLAFNHVFDSIIPGANLDFDISIPSIPITLSALNNIGTTFTFGLGGAAEAIGGGSGFATVEGDFFSSIHWGGISAVRNRATGELLQDWTIVSDTGFDYTKSFDDQLPEPASWLLFVGSLAAWSLDGNRQKKCHPRNLANQG